MPRLKGTDDNNKPSSFYYHLQEQSKQIISLNHYYSTLFIPKIRTRCIAGSFAINTNNKGITLTVNKIAL